MNRPPRSQDPLYAGLRQGQRSQDNLRGPPGSAGNQPKPNGKTAETDDRSQGRAARFEDEKKRIIESLFSKKDDDGVIMESYITHVRVTEDAMYPSSPPPPDSDPSSKKNRVVLVAVRRSGRVRVHKGRENPSGTFSIGKTWNLDELSSIQSYTNLIPRTNQEQLEKQWANGIGFIVTLGKAYYWSAPTAKEKDFFIASLVKIFRKYTGGRMPELYGFAGKEVETLAGTTPVQSPPASLAPSSMTLLGGIETPPPIPAASERRPQSPYSTKSQGGDSNKDTSARMRSQSRTESAPPRRDDQRAPPPPEPLRTPTRSQSRDDLPKASNVPSLLSGSAIYSPPTAPFAASSSSAHSSQTSLTLNERQSSGVGNGLPTRSKPPFAEATRNTSSISNSSRPSTAVSEYRSLDPKADKNFTSDDVPPERRRPFMPKADSRPASRSGQRSDAESQFATPAASPSDLQEELPAIATVGNNVPDRPPSPVKQKDYFAAKEEPKAAEPVDSKVQSPSTPFEEAISPSVESPSQEYRPGLGPMIKKKSTKDIAGQFRKAAMAAGAFQPRQGGGAARLKALQDKDRLNSEPDGITGVVPAPLLRGKSAEKSVPSTPTLAEDPQKVETPSATESVPAVQIQRTATQDSVVTVDPITAQPSPAKQKPLAQPNATKVKVEIRTPSPEKARSRSPQRRKQQRQQAEIARYCSALGIDPRILDGRGADFNDLLTEFRWEGRLVGNRRIDDFEAEIKREIGRAQATGWLGHVEQQEGKVQDLARAFDHAIEECEELDGLFTLYSHELDTLAADIEYIEAQSQGLQVQTANQKLLQAELQNLLKTLSIPPAELRGLRSASIDTPTGVARAEKSLALLYRALITIDPNIRQNQVRQANGAGPERSGVGVYADTEIGQMRAVREKKDEYREEAVGFVQRFSQHMLAIFTRLEKRNLEQSKISSSSTTLDPEKYRSSRKELWCYNALMLFTREVNSHEWKVMIRAYETQVKVAYQNDFAAFDMSQRRTAHKPTGEDLDVLFTTHEKEKLDDGLASTAARKLTVRRGKNPRSTTQKQDIGSVRDGKPEAYVVFSNILKQQTQVISEEQNFISHFFHLISQQANVEFAEIVSARRPEDRQLPDLARSLGYEPDRNYADIATQAVERIYEPWVAGMRGLLSWALSIDQLQGIGIMSALEVCQASYDGSNQDFIVRSVRVLHEQLIGLFKKFTDEQIRAIEETKVKVKKRKGVISFMRTFPAFASALERMAPPGIDHPPLVRVTLDEAYGNILKAMWDSLKFIAKNVQSGGAGVGASAPASGDYEDKEKLNFYILMIENMAYFLEEVDTDKSSVLKHNAQEAEGEFDKYMKDYVNTVIHRPLGKWLEFVEKVEVSTQNSTNPSTSSSLSIISKPSQSRSSAKKLLSTHDAKEIRKGIETLKKRVEKHFSDVDDNVSTTQPRKPLVDQVLDECAKRYADAWERMKVIIDRVYTSTDGGASVLEIDWKVDEAVTLLKTR